MSNEWREGYELISTAKIRTVLEGKKPDGVLTEKIRYRTIDRDTGKEYISESRVQALAVGILIENYGIDPEEHNSDCIPIEIVTDSNPAIVAYLLGALGYSRRDVCQILDISNQTVAKYIARMRR
ncbi:hypothetical protein [Halobellus salinus]|nr:hypothetical protein [Halobellus salinus]SMP14414.1 hypothetical protein SAMN06265347_1058 [Halobellus salinus]